MVSIVCLVALLAVAKANSFGYNIALSRPTGSSSVFVNGVPPVAANSNLAVDGNFNPDFFGGSCFSSTDVATDPNPFWFVDLGSRVFVSGITLTNRADCCADRLSGLTIEVFEFNPTSSSETPEFCSMIIGGVALGQTVARSCSPMVTGRYVRIRKPSATAPLTICEVVVSGGNFNKNFLNIPFSNVARNRPVRVTSQFSLPSANLIASPGLAVDGNFDSQFVTGRSCYSSAIGNTSPTFYIDLGDYFNIQSITLTNRGDCCAERLRNINIGTLLKDPYRYLEFPKLCGTITGNVAAGANVTVSCFAPTVARYIKIQKTSMVDSNDLLTFCEVQVTGRFASRSEVTNKSVDNDVSQALAANGIIARAETNDNWSG
ncbi:uncharacterized protein LOC124143479 [Haliotis rufescens]|uniref:uncharacterized protein LOC124143479 n=1 Tax=Haliotis rufescens TaxID=6454 RepID=UPI001EB028AC|nr:uncharacterized protein LOC124143479 [Haliotis rufescens]